MPRVPKYIKTCHQNTMLIMLISSKCESVKISSKMIRQKEKPVVPNILLLLDIQAVTVLDFRKMVNAHGNLVFSNTRALLVIVKIMEQTNVGNHQKTLRRGEVPGNPKEKNLDLSKKF